MTRTPKRHMTSSLDDIPPELVIDILSRVAASSIADISSVKLCSKELKDLAEDSYIYRHASLEKFPLVEWTPLGENQHKFLKKCQENRNAELIYREAVLDFFNKNKLGSALKNARKAFDLGHPGGLYVMCVIYILSGDDGLKRKGMKLIGSCRKSVAKARSMKKCRNKLLAELRQIWVNNPIIREEEPICCSAHQWRNGWLEGKEESCDGCNADEEIRFIHSRISV